MYENRILNMPESEPVQKINSTKNATVKKFLCKPLAHRPIEQVLMMLLAHATKIPGLIFLSGQTPVDQTGKVVEGGIEEHTVSCVDKINMRQKCKLICCQTQCINNLGNVLEAAGSSWEKVVKVNIYLKDLNDYGAMNAVYERVRLNKVRHTLKAE